MEPITITAIAIGVAVSTALAPLGKLVKSLAVWSKESNPANQRRIIIKQDGEVSEIEYELDKMDSETLSAILSMLEGKELKIKLDNQKMDKILEKIEKIEIE